MKKIKKKRGRPPKVKVKIKKEPKIIGLTKNCPQCTGLLKLKARVCKCGFRYILKKKSPLQEIQDWQTLKEGSIIYLTKKSRGPYYQGEMARIPMSYRGKFTVRFLKEKGIIAYSSAAGFAYIYMGEPYLCPDTAIYNRKYRIYKRI